MCSAKRQKIWRTIYHWLKIKNAKRYILPCEQFFIISTSIVWCCKICLGFEKEPFCQNSSFKGPNCSNTRYLLRLQAWSPNAQNTVQPPNFKGTTLLANESTAQAFRHWQPSKRAHTSLPHNRMPQRAYGKTALLFPYWCTAALGLPTLSALPSCALSLHSVPASNHVSWCFPLHNFPKINLFIFSTFLIALYTFTGCACSCYASHNSSSYLKLISGLCLPQ